MTKQQKYSKSDNFVRVCTIINHDLFWCQKLPKTNLWMTLGLIFNHLFKKHHFGAFSVFHTKYSLIFGDKKIQTQKWCIREKFRQQKLGVTKGFFRVNFFSIFDFGHCLEKWLQRHLEAKQFQKNLIDSQLRNVQRHQKHVLLVRWFIFRVFYLFELTVYHDLTLNAIMLSEDFSILPYLIFVNQFSNYWFFTVEDCQLKPWSLCTLKALMNSFSNIIKCLSY